MRTRRGRREAAVTGVYSLAVVAAYVGWLGWRAQGDPSAGAVIGALLTASVLTLVAAWWSRAPRRLAWTGFAVAMGTGFVDSALLPGSLWLAAAVVLGPVVLAAFWGPAALLALAFSHRWPAPAQTPPPPAEPPLTADEQVEAWRTYLRRSGRAAP